MSSLEESFDQENPIRFIKTWIQNQDFKKEGRPSFESSTLLKIYLYGNLIGLRSSRRLESECFRNIELQWLTLGLNPNYHSIADLRKNNPMVLKCVFKLFILALHRISTQHTTPIMAM